MIGERTSYDRALKSDIKSDLKGALVAHAESVRPSRLPSASDFLGKTPRLTPPLIQKFWLGSTAGGSGEFAKKATLPIRSSAAALRARTPRLTFHLVRPLRLDNTPSDPGFARARPAR
jgi:hypothetical protein